VRWRRENAGVSQPIITPSVRYPIGCVALRM
jgi:hypothetical protein